MSENNTIQIKKDLQQITDMLLLNGTLTECPGLVHGKMGIAILHNIQIICCLLIMLWT